MEIIDLKYGTLNYNDEYFKVQKDSKVDLHLKDENRHDKEKHKNVKQSNFQELLDKEMDKIAKTK